MCTHEYFAFTSLYMPKVPMTGCWLKFHHSLKAELTPSQFANCISNCGEIRTKAKLGQCDDCLEVSFIDVLPLTQLFEIQTQQKAKTNQTSLPSCCRCICTINTLILIIASGALYSMNLAWIFWLIFNWRKNVDQL